MKPVIGIIGAIGAGKSAVAKAFTKHGGVVINADELGHKALAEPDVLAQLVHRWGESILNSDGSANRRAIAKIVFASGGEREILEILVFPVISRMTRAEIERLNHNEECSFVVLDAAVLLEANWALHCDKIVYVDAPFAQRLHRVTQRSQWTEADLRSRELAQWPAERKKEFASVVIVNDSSLEELQLKVDELVEAWQLGSSNGRR